MDLFKAWFLLQQNFVNLDASDGSAFPTGTRSRERRSLSLSLSLPRSRSQLPYWRASAGSNPRSPDTQGIRIACRCCHFPAPVPGARECTCTPTSISVPPLPPAIATIGINRRFGSFASRPSPPPSLPPPILLKHGSTGFSARAPRDDDRRRDRRTPSSLADRIDPKSAARRINKSRDEAPSDASRDTSCRATFGRVEDSISLSFFLSLARSVRGPSKSETCDVRACAPACERVRAAAARARTREHVRMGAYPCVRYACRVVRAPARARARARV